MKKVRDLANGTYFLYQEGVWRKIEDIFDNGKLHHTEVTLELFKPDDNWLASTDDELHSMDSYCVVQPIKVVTTIVNI